VPDAIKYDLFDMAVHSGVITAIKTLQRTVGVNDDGNLGPITLQAVTSMPALRFVARFNGARLQFMSALPTWPSFGRGWANRIAKNLLEV
jgi:lysozyme family protein